MKNLKEIKIFIDFVKLASINDSLMLALEKR
jgi:hypothetical protein